MLYISNGAFGLEILYLAVSIFSVARACSVSRSGEFYNLGHFWRAPVCLNFSPNFGNFETHWRLTFWAKFGPHNELGAQRFNIFCQLLGRFAKVGRLFTLNIWSGCWLAGKCWKVTSNFIGAEWTLDDFSILSTKNILKSQLNCLY